MKILIVQLARLGDILTTAPTVNALRRIYPDAQIHMLVRDRFKEACSGLSALDAVWTLNSRSILAPLVLENRNIERSLGRLNVLISSIKAENFTKVINLSFSPISSFLSYAIDPKNEKTTGYTRHADGFLNSNDDASSYFYAQVGINGSNRIHTADLFAQVAGINLARCDWRLECVSRSDKLDLPSEYVVVHVGASQKFKMYSATHWAEIISRLNSPTILVGAANEKYISKEILEKSKNSKVVDLVGKTSFSDLFSIVQNAQILIGADSVPVHIASLTGTKCLNLSCASVNFWETGPRSIGSRVILKNSMDEISADEVLDQFNKMVLNEPAGKSAIEVIDAIPSYNETSGASNEFCWSFIKGLYLGGELPEVHDYETICALVQLREVNDVMADQIRLILERSDKQTHSKIIDQADAIILEIKKLCPNLHPLISWFEVERTRIPPGNVRDIAIKNLKICKDLEHILSLYLGPSKPLKGKHYENFAMESVPDFE